MFFISIIPISWKFVLLKFDNFFIFIFIFMVLVLVGPIFYQYGFWLKFIFLVHFWFNIIIYGSCKFCWFSEFRLIWHNSCAFLLGISIWKMGLSMRQMNKWKKTLMRGIREADRYILWDWVVRASKVRFPFYQHEHYEHYI